MKKGLLIWNIVLTLFLAIVIFIGVVEVNAFHYYIKLINERFDSIETTVNKNADIVDKYFAEIKNAIDANVDIINANAEAITRNAQISEKMKNTINEILNFLQLSEKPADNTT